MSVRDPSVFSLRQVAIAETEQRPFFMSKAPDSTHEKSRLDGFFSSTSTTVPEKTKGLKFDFTSIQQQHKKLVVSSGIPPRMESTVNNTSKTSHFRNAFVHSVDTGNNCDTMRLTVMVEDLQMRLKKASDRAKAVECQLTKTHQCLITERNKAASTATAVSKELGNAHVVENNLRSELHKANNIAKQSVSRERYDEVISANMLADSETVKTRKELSDTKKANSDAHEKINLLRHEMDEIHAKSESILNSVNGANAIVTEELEQAKHEKLQLSSELVVLQSCLRDEANRTSSVQGELQELKSTHAITVEQLNLVHTPSEFVPVHEPPNIASEPTSMDFTSLDQQHRTLTTDVTEVCYNKRADPVRMYNNYHKLRNRLSDVEMQIESSSQSCIPELLKRRDSLFLKASALKVKYDTIFGTDVNSTVESNETDGVNDENENDIAVLGGATSVQFRIFGDAPPAYRVPLGSNMAHEMSAMCPLGGAVQEGHVDASFDIGVYPVPLGSAIDQSVDNNPESTGNHDAKNDMVNAVVADLTEFMKDCQQRRSVYEEMNTAVEENGGVCDTECDTKET